MKFLFDIFPVVAFFIAYYIPDDPTQRIFLATAVTIVAVVIQVAVMYLWKKRLEKMHLFTLAIVLLLGGATLLTRDRSFILWKPTIVNWLFAASCMISEFVSRKPLIRHIMEHAITLPDQIWLAMNRRWTIFFFALGTLNLYVAFKLSEEIWVNFKLFGIIALTTGFAILQALLISKHLVTDSEDGHKEEARMPVVHDHKTEP
ncbi:MAG: septation protein A [Candidatus Eutrophobiaceae bacterium]